MGRLKLNPEDARSEFLPKIRVTPDEKEKYEKKAKKEGLTFSQWVRKTLQKASK